MAIIVHPVNGGGGGGAIGAAQAVIMAAVKGPAAFGIVAVVAGGIVTVTLLAGFTPMKTTVAVQVPVFSSVPLTIENGTPTISGTNGVGGVPQPVVTVIVSSLATVVPRLRLPFPGVPVSPVVTTFPVVELELELELES
ncbi:hypothetical protein [Domibacillus epiphyticus]|uniref:hypothetical protein n=1 Tax=Domibacillus epiphyticus TaxID=1714355 RepID=UPI0011869473|nr:hypothetical protein [Domibacillus epiphyticus]